MPPSVTLTLQSSQANSLLLPLRLDPSKDYHQQQEWRQDSKSNQVKSWQSGTGLMKSESVYFGLLIVIWYSVSVGHNLLNKRLLEPDLFPYPFTLTLLQLASITGYSYIYIAYISSDRKRHSLVTVHDVLGVRRNRSLVIFLSFGKFLALVFSHLSLSQVPLAFTHTGG